MISRKETTSPLSRTDILLTVLIGIGALALYIRTLAPSLLWGDSAEFQTLSYTLGMTHPSGYMTQIMIGKLFTLIPVDNIAYRVNLMSAFFGALAAAQVYLIVRLLGGWRVAGISASMMLGLMPNFWWRAVIAESYAPAAGMTASVWLCVLLWKRFDNWRFLFLAGLLGGLSIGIHSTVVMTAASVLVYMALTARQRADWFGAAAGAILGTALTFSFFLFLDAHDPPSSIYNTVYRPSLSALGLTPGQFNTPLKHFFAIFPANQFWTYYFTAAPEEVGRRLIEYISFFPVWGNALIILGAFTLFINGKWREGLYPLIAFLIIWGFAVTVAFSIYREFYVPVAVFVFAWLGAGASASLDGLSRLLEQVHVKGGMMRNVVIGIVSILLITLPIYESREDLVLAIRRGYTTFIKRDHIYTIFAPDKAIQDAMKVIRHVEDNAIVFAEWDKLYSYIYTAHIEEGRTGVAFHEATITDDPHLAGSALDYIDANIDNRPIYFAVFMPELTERYQVEQINESLYRIRRK